MRIFCPLFACLVLLCDGDCLFADTDVRLRTDDRNWLTGRQITVLRVDGENEYSEVASNLRMSARGECNLQLPRGRYRFEVFDDTRPFLLCVRSDEVDVGDSPVEVSLSVGEVRVKLEDQGESLAIARLAVRSWAPRGEMERVFNNLEEIKLYASPNAELDLRVIGHVDDLVVLGWTRVRAQSNVTVSTDGSTWRRCSIEPHPVNPPLASSTVHLRYPLGELVLPTGTKLTLVTNQPRVEMRYSLVSKSRKRLVSRNELADIVDGGRILLGGRLVPTAYAKIMTRLPSQKNLIDGTALNDTDGREIDLEKSHIGWMERSFLRGQPFSIKNPLDDVERGLIADPIETMRYQVAWNWTERQQLEIAPTSFVKFRSRKFTLFAPSGWSGRASNYLSILERASTVLRENTGRRGPWRTVVYWRLNTHNAKAQVGGSNPWMSMPFKGLRGASRPQGQPWFMIHEMLHTFGYNHGSTMNQQESRGRQGLGKLQWRIPHELYSGDDDDDYKSEQEIFLLHIPDDLKSFLTVSPDLETTRDVTILDAKFCEGKHETDVTEVVKRAFASESQMIDVNVSGLGLSKPRRGKKRSLTIRYQIDDEEKTIEIPAGKKQEADLGVWLH